MSPTRPESPALVACLCAQWCLTCGAYRAVFDSAAVEFAGVRFVWVDVEDLADVVDPVEVENFPTLLIGVGHEVRFFGTVTPHADTLKRLVQSQLAADAPSTQADPDVQGLLARLQHPG